MPKLIATQVLELAHRLNSGENFDLVSKSKAAKNDAIVPSKSKVSEIIIKSKLPDQETEYDFVINSKIEEESERITESTTTSLRLNEIITNSNITEYEAIKIAKKILKHH